MRTQPHTRTCSFLCQRRPFRLSAGLLALLFLAVALAFPRGVFSEPLPSSRVVRFAVEKALKGLNVPGVEIVAQGSWISGKNYRDPRFQQLITDASDHDMRLFFRRPGVSTAEALEVWKKFRMNVQEELKALVDRGIISSDELGVLRNSTNIYPPEELMKEIQTSEQAVAQFGKWGIYPSLAEVGKEGSGGSYGQMLKFERQGYENTERAIVLYLDKGEVRAGSADLNHMLEGHGLRTPENLAKAAENNLADALKAVKAKNLKDTSKYLKRAKDYLKEAKGKLRTKANPNDQKLLDLEKKLDEMVTKFEEVETRAGLLSEKVLAKTAEGAALQKQIAGEFEKMADDAEKVLSEAADDSLFAQKLGAAVGEGKTSASRLYRGLLEGADKWAKARPQVRAGLSRLTDTGQKIGFLNALAAYWAIKDLPEVYVKEGAQKATARFGMSLTTMAVPEIALGELVAVIATTVAEIAVDYVGSYGYRAVTSTQDCFDLIAGFYTVYGREAQVLGEGLKKCHQVNSVRGLANDIYDKDDLRGTVQRTQKLDGRLIPSELNSMIACHAENASKRFDEETKTDKGVEEALIAKCTGPIVAAWLEERELAIEEVQVLVSDVERSELRVGYDTNAAVLKKGSTRAQVTVSAQIIPALGDLPEQIKTRMQGPGGRGSKPSVYQNVTWKLDGSKVTSGSALSYDFTFDKPGMQSVCAEWEMQYDVYNTSSTLAPTGLSGKVQRTGCVDVVVAEELEADKLVVAITGPNKAKAPEKSETGRKIPLVAELTSKRDPKEFQYVWTAEGGFSEAGRTDDRFQTFEYGQPGTYTIKVEIYDASDTWKVKEIKRAKLAEATHKITVEPSVKDAKIELKVSGPKEIVLGNPINLSVEVVAEERIKAKLKPPAWFMGRGGRVILSPDDDSFETTQTGQSIGQGATASYTPRDAGTYDFSVNVFGEGVSGPAASGSQRVEVNCRVVGKDTKCKDEGAPAEEKLSVILIPDRTNVASGETVNVNAVAQGGTPVYRFTWAEPARGDGPSASFVASPASRGVRVEVKDGKGQTAQGSLTIAVDKPPVMVEGLKDKVLFGTWLDLRVPVEQGNYARWQSSPTVSFKPEETSDGKTTVTFDRMDKIKVWAEIMARKGEVSETVNSSDPVDVMVNAPDVKIEFDPSLQVTGKEVTAEVKWGAYFDTSLVRYVWLTPPTSNREEVLPGRIRFKVADRQSIPVEVEVRAARSDQTVVSLKRSFDPDGKPTTTEVKTGDDGTASKKKQDAAALLVKAKESVGAGRLDEGINQAGEAIKLDPALTEAVNLEKKWKAEKQTVNQQLDKTKKAVTQNQLDQADKEFAVAQKLHPKYAPVVETEKLLKAKKDEYKKSVADKLNKARELAKQGKLDEAIALADDASKLDKAGATPVLNELSALSKKQGWDHVYNRNFKDAVKRLEDAARLNPTDQDATGKLAQAKKFAGVWPQVEQKAKEFDQLVSEKKVFSAQKKMLEVQDLQREMTGGMANPLSKRVTDDFNKALQEYNEFRKGVEQKYTDYFKEKNWEEGQKLVQESLKRELHPADEKNDRSRLAQCQQMLEGQKQVWDFYQKTKADFEQNRIKEPSRVAQELRQKASLYGDRAPQHQQMVSLANSLEKKSGEDQSRMNTAKQLRGEGEALQKQNKLQEAIAKYKESLKYWPDPSLEEHIRVMEAKTAKDNEAKVAADRLWKEGSDSLNAGKPSEALTKLKESLKYSLSPERVKYVQDLEGRKTEAERLRNEGASWQNQGKLREAAGKYRESLKYWPDPALTDHIARIEAEIKKQETAVVTQPVPPVVSGTPVVTQQPGASFPLQVVRNVPGQNSSAFKKNVRNDLSIDTTSYDKIPYSMYASSHDLMIAAPGKFCLAGDAGGTKGWNIDNFLLIEVLDQSGNLISSAVAGSMETVRRNGNPAERIGRNSFSFDACEIDVTKLLPVSRPFKLRTSAMDYGGTGYVSDVFVVSSRGTSGVVSQPAPQPPTAPSRYYHVDLTPYGGKKGSPRKVKEIEVDDGSWVRLKATDEKRLTLAINLPQPVTANAVAVVTNLDNAHNVPDGFVTTVLTVLTTSGERRFEFKAGIHSSEWNRSETGGAEHKWPKETYIGDKRWMPIFQLPQGSVVTGLRFDHKDPDKKMYHMGAAPGFCLRGITLVTSGSAVAVTTGTSQPVVSPVQPPRSFDGTYSGAISGAASGTIQITVAGDRASGTINGTYQGDRFSGSWSGAANKTTGELQGTLKGDISGYAFTGSITGRIQGTQATGNWNAKNQYGNPTGTWQATRGGTATSTGTSAVTAGTSQGKTSVMAEFTNSSKMNTHIFTEGETFSPSNRLAPGEKRKVSVQMAPNGTVTFKAGRDGQVMATKRWDGEAGNPNRVPVVTFDDTNPFDKLSVATGLR